jgi:hypothetical protein
MEHLFALIPAGNSNPTNHVRRAHTLDSVGILFKEILQYYSQFCPRKTSGTYSRDIAL